LNKLPKFSIRGPRSGCAHGAKAPTGISIFIGGGSIVSCRIPDDRKDALQTKRVLNVWDADSRGKVMAPSSQSVWPPHCPRPFSLAEPAKGKSRVVKKIGDDCVENTAHFIDKHRSTWLNNPTSFKNAQQDTSEAMS
jgi:hypothetical protein